MCVWTHTIYKEPGPAEKRKERRRRERRETEGGERRERRRGRRRRETRNKSHPEWSGEEGECDVVGRESRGTEDEDIVIASHGGREITDGIRKKLTGRTN